MKKILLTLVVMLLVGVQGYAQSRPVRPHYYNRPTPIVYGHSPSYGYYYEYDEYAYSSTSRPTKVRIKDMEFKRTSSGRLRIKNGKEKAIYLDTYKYNKVGYGNGESHIVIETKDGNATITVLDNNKEVIAIYTL